MKYLIALLAFISTSAMALTLQQEEPAVINYPDGSTYTLGQGEKIYISGVKLFTKKNYNNGNVYFVKQDEHARRDYEAQPHDGLTGHEWCLAYVPWSEGLTFGMVHWQSACDVNSDGVYDMCDYYQPTGMATFEDLEWQNQCNDGEPWDGSQPNWYPRDLKYSP